MARKIKINSPKYGDKFAIVDDDDYDFLLKYTWTINRGYARSRESRLCHPERKQKQISMHRLIMKVTDPKIQIDHINHNKLDNRKCNLRIATGSQNQANIKAHSRNKAGLKGVRLNHKKWEASICKNGIIYYLGTFDIKEEAAKAYDEAAIRLFEEFAYINGRNTNDI